MPNTDFILVSQSEAIDSDRFAGLPLDRMDLYRDLVYPRMVWYRDGFRQHTDVLNHLRFGKFFADAGPAERRRMYSVWNLPGFIALHIPNYLAGHGINAKVFNNIDAEWDRFQQACEASSAPPLVGISTTFHLSYSELSRLAKKLRALAPDSDLVLGGAFANAQALHQEPSRFESHMRKHGIRYVLHGFNSEPDLRDLLLQLRDGGALSAVANLAYIEGDLSSGPFHTTQSQWQPPVLDEAPCCYNQLGLPFVNHTVQLRTQSGCPFSCAFCSYPETARGVHRMNMARFEEHLEAVLALEGVRNLVFIDDTLNVPQDRFEQLCRMLCKHDVNWFSFLRGQYINPETARLMRDSGCVAVYLGIESANDEVLRNMQKRATRKGYAEGVRHLTDAGIFCMGAFVLGFPGETQATIQEDVDFIEESGLDFFTVKDFYYMEHTPVHEKREHYGLRGSGSKWAHDTMDSRQAHEAGLRMLHEVRKSVFIDPDSNLWFLAYMYDQGYGMDTLKAIQTELNTLVREQLEGRCDDAHPAFERLADLVQGED